MIKPEPEKKPTQNARIGELECAAASAAVKIMKLEEELRTLRDWVDGTIKSKWTLWERLKWIFIGKNKYVPWPQGPVVYHFNCRSVMPEAASIPSEMVAREKKGKLKRIRVNHEGVMSL